MKTCIELDWRKVMAPKDFDLSENRKFLQCNGGIYLWIFKGTPHRVTYVGESNCFLNRLLVEFSLAQQGKWNTYDMDESDDFVRFLYDHYHDKTLEEIIANNKYFMANQPDFTPSAIHRKYLDNLSFAFAANDLLGDKNIRKQVESILIAGLRLLYARSVKDEKIELIRSKRSLSYDIPIGNINNNPTDSFTISHVGDAVNDIPDDVVKIVGFDLGTRQPTFAH